MTMRSDDGGPAIAPFDKLRVSGSGAIALRSVAAMALHLRETMTAEMFDAWTETAQPGARQIYGVGIDAHSASCPGVAKRMRELSDAGLVRLHLVRARKHYGTWVLAGEALGIGSSSIQNLAGNHAKFSFRTASVLLDWDRANPARGEQDAVPVKLDTPDAVTGAVTEAPLPEPFEQNSTAAPLVEPSPGFPVAAVDGALAVSPPPAPQTIPALVAANDDPFAVALTAIVKARDTTKTAQAAIQAEIDAIDAQIAPLVARKALLAVHEATLFNRMSELVASVDRLQAAAQ